MIEQIYSLFNYNIIYLSINLGVLPFWLVLFFFPESKISNFFVTSAFPYFVFGSIYIYIIYYLFISDYDFIENFTLYIGLDNLVELFSNKEFIITFWLHFLAISLFAGSWIVRDSKKYLIPKIITIPSLILTYFTGPIGLVIYWFFRIFFAKKISFND